MKCTPTRMCLACRSHKDKRELIRVVKSPSDDVSLDFTGKKPGRGAYICLDIECMEKAKKHKLLNKAFKCQVSDEVYNKLMEDLVVAKG